MQRYWRLKWRSRTRWRICPLRESIQWQSSRSRRIKRERESGAVDRQDFWTENKRPFGTSRWNVPSERWATRLLLPIHVRSKRKFERIKIFSWLIITHVNDGENIGKRHVGEEKKQDSLDVLNAAVGRRLPLVDECNDGGNQLTLHKPQSHPGDYQQMSTQNPLTMVWNALTLKTAGSLTTVNQDLHMTARNWANQLALYGDRLTSKGLKLVATLELNGRLASTCSRIFCPNSDAS